MSIGLSFWEAAVVICVYLICHTFKAIMIRPTIETISADEFEMLKTAVGVIKTDHEAIHKLAEETKKLLSQQNLAQGFKR